MRGRDRDRRPERGQVRSGLWILAGLTAVVLAVFFLDELRRAVEEGPRLVVLTRSAAELEPGSAVWVAGRPAGRVLSVRFRRDPAPAGTSAIAVEAVLHREAAGVLREDARARIARAGLMAPAVLRLSPGSPRRAPYDFRDTLRGTVDLADREEALARLDTLRAAIARARPLASRLRAALSEGGGTLAALRRDPAAARALDRRLRELDDLLRGGAEGEPGTLGRIATDTALFASLAGVGSSLERLSAEREAGRAPGPGLRGLLASLDGLETTLVALERDLRSGRGALGRALYDTAIRRQADLLRARMDSVRLELVEHPLRWLRFRIF